MACPSMSPMTLLARRATPGPPGNTASPGSHPRTPGQHRQPGEPPGPPGNTASPGSHPGPWHNRFS